MKLLQCRPIIYEYNDLESFVETMAFCPRDLILSNRYIFDISKHETNGANVIYQEDYGRDEPDEAMLAGIKSAIQLFALLSIVPILLAVDLLNTLAPFKAHPKIGI